jgi:hypothetical protein
MRVISGMEIKADRKEILEKLKKNRETHAQIVKEAREGYVEEAQKVLAKRMAEIKEGKLVGLTFSLSPPQDFTHVYDTAITMLEFEKRETVRLNDGQVRTLIMDEWDWTRNFLVSNSRMSASAMAEGRAKGYEIS